jgi:hypothetical protein
MSGAHGDHGRRNGLWLLGIGVASVAASLTVRVVHRGAYFSGWDLVAATQGHFLASTLSFSDAIRHVWYQNRHFWLPFPIYSVPFALTAGYLERLLPWLYWDHLLSLVSFVATLVLIAAATGLPWQRFGALLLAWGASSTLLSYSVVGYPWVSGFVPHALALYVVMNRHLHTRPLLTACLAALAAESCWHVYQAGRTASLVFLAALVFFRRVPLTTRAIWLAAAAVQIIEAGLIHTSSSPPVYQLHGWEVAGLDAVGVPFFGERLGHLDAALVWKGVEQFSAHLWSFFDLPTVWLLGATSFAFFRRDRWFLLSLLLFNTALLVFIAIPVGVTTGDALRPRRFIAIEGYSLVAIASMMREAGPAARRAFVALLLLGNVWQGVNLAQFVHRPRAEVEFPMPYMSSSEGVGLVSHTQVDVSRALLARVEAGERILLLYNFSCYAENLTNPQGIIERLYLSLGHERFVRSVLVFGSSNCRYSCLPIRPLPELATFLDGVRPGGPTPPDLITGYYVQNCRVSEGMGGNEVDQMFATIRERLPIKLEDSATPHLLRFSFQAGAAGATVDGAPEASSPPPAGLACAPACPSPSGTDS